MKIHRSKFGKRFSTKVLCDEPLQFGLTISSSYLKFSTEKNDKDYVFSIELSYDEAQNLVESFNRYLPPKEQIMPKQQITIEVDIPDGYEATGEFRLPDESRECWLSNFNAVCEPHDGRATVHGPRLILRKKWQWPEWLRLTYIAMDISGQWYGFSEEPTLQRQSGGWDCHRYVYLLSPEYFDFTPPPCTDWKQSLRKNPNAK